MNNNIHFAALLVICLSAGVVFYSRWDPRNREAGESRHYVASTVTLLNAGRISFTKRDLRSVEDVFGKLIPYKHWTPYKPSDRTPLHKLATVDAKSPDYIGRSFYWGTYSFLCIPAYWFCRTFHIFDSNMFNAFKWTNILMLLAPLFAIVFLLKGPARMKYLMLGAFAFPSVAQYVNWASAECCIYALVTLCLIFLHNREYCRSSLCLSFAATLNYTLAPLALPVLFCFLSDHREDFSFKPFHMKKDFIKKLLLLGCCYLPVFHAAFWTWLQYSSISIVAITGATADFLWERFWAYLFDLNLGIYVYHPVSLTVFLFSIFVIGWKRDWQLLLLWISFFGIILGFSFMVNIQGGVIGISRYGAWCAPVAVYVAVCVLERYATPWIAGSLVTLSAVFSAVILIWPFHTSGSRFNALAQFVLTHHPSWYDPFYPIFTTRVSPSQVKGQIYKKIPVPIVYYNRGSCGKIVLWHDQVEHFLDYMKAHYDINDAAYREIERQRKKLLKKKRKYYYINLSEDCVLVRRFFPAAALAFKGAARREERCIVLDKGGVQFGPYAPFESGSYHVRISGANLDKLRFRCSANSGKKTIRISNLKCSKTTAEYDVNFEDYSQKVEFVARNLQSEPAKISSITLSRR